MAFLRAHFPHLRLEGFLADREFIGEAWFRYLEEKGIPRCIRIKANTRMWRLGSGPRAWELFASLELGAQAGVLGLRAAHVGGGVAPWGPGVADCGYGPGPSPGAGGVRAQVGIERLFGALKGRGEAFAAFDPLEPGLRVGVSDGACAAPGASGEAQEAREAGTEPLPGGAGPAHPLGACPLGCRGRKARKSLGVMPYGGFDVYIGRVHRLAHRGGNIHPSSRPLRGSLGVRAAPFGGLEALCRKMAEVCQRRPGRHSHLLFPPPLLVVLAGPCHPRFDGKTPRTCAGFGVGSEGRVKS